MILDNNLMLSGAVSAAGVLSGQLLTNNSTLSTNTIDLSPLSIGSNQVQDQGAGEDLVAVVSILVAPTTCTDVTFQLVQADDAALSSGLQVIAQTGAIAIASLPAGTVVPLRYGMAAPLAPKRYLGIRYVATGATIAAASVVASIVKDVQSVRNMLYRSGYAVS